MIFCSSEKAILKTTIYMVIRIHLESKLENSDSLIPIKYIVKCIMNSRLIQTLICKNTENSLTELHPTCKSVYYELKTFIWTPILWKIILIHEGLHSTCLVYSRIWRVWSEHWSGCAIHQREPLGKCSYTSRWRNGWCLSRSPTSCRSHAPGKKSSERKDWV